MNYHAHRTFTSTYTCCVGCESECLSKLIYSLLNSDVHMCVYVNERQHRYTNLSMCTRPCVTVSLSQDETKDFECVSENHTKEADERKED